MATQLFYKVRHGAKEERKMTKRDKPWRPNYPKPRWIKEVRRPDAPYRVCGHDWYGDYDIPCSSFVQAILTFRYLRDDAEAISIKGISRVVRDRIKREEATRKEK
jgi:hypothetical protein